MTKQTACLERQFGRLYRAPPMALALQVVERLTNGTWSLFLRGRSFGVVGGKRAIRKVPVLWQVRAVPDNGNVRTQSVNLLNY